MLLIFGVGIFFSVYIIRRSANRVYHDMIFICHLLPKAPAILANDALVGSTLVGRYLREVPLFVSEEARLARLVRP